jgi:hypothetical protein
MASWLDNLLGLNQGDPLLDASKRNTGLINQLDTTGTGYLNQAKDITGDYLNLGKSGANAYANATGVNGAAGNAEALANFQAGPGYQFGLDQGLQALQRTASSQGRLQSGNTDIDLLQYGVKAANDEWGNYIDRLGGYNNMYGAGVGAATKSLGDLTSFKSGITSDLISANNQRAEGETTNNAGWGQLAGNVANIAGKFLGFGGF